MLQIDIFLNTKILKTKTDHKSTEIISILIQNFPKNKIKFGGANFSPNQILCVISSELLSVNR